MSDHNPKVEPVRFDAAGTQTPTDPPESGSADHAPESRQSEQSAGAPKWVLPALAGLVLLALLVFFWLPSRVETPHVEVDIPVQAAEPKAGTRQISPWQDAQQGKLRKQAQEILSKLLDLQFSLEETNAEQWAGEAFARAKTLAAEGDRLYREQQFVESAASYQAALDELQAISDSSDSLFEEMLASGRLAIEQEDASAAIAALQTALLIQPAHVEAAQLMARAQNLEQVLDLLEQAEAYRAAGELDQAAALLQQASAIDPDNERARAEINQLGREITRRNFNSAMTRGYSALDQGRFDAAETAFRQASKLMPSSAETESALQETRAARTSSRIEALRSKAEKAANTEQWQTAQETYQKIMDIDSSVVFARVGLIMSRERAAIDKQLKNYIAEPHRLGDDAIYQSARRVYADASALDIQGPLLKEQLRQMGEILRVAQQPVKVVLKSDEQTQVTVFKVARLGTFLEHQLELKPGTYTAVGARSGYRDVRHTFSVSHSQAPPMISIVCTEKI
jgi:tetratricopeptide (TPR) repeat protein